MGTALRMPGLSILGLGDLQTEIDKTAQELREAEDPAAMAAGEPILERWKALVPVLDEHYRNSLVLVWLGAKQGAAIGTSWLPTLPREEQPFLYSKPLEFGNSHQSAQPSARPALAASQAEALEAGGNEFRSVIKGRKPRKRRPTK